MQTRIFYRCFSGTNESGPSRNIVNKNGINRKDHGKSGIPGSYIQEEVDYRSKGEDNHRSGSKTKNTKGIHKREEDTNLILSKEVQFDSVMSMSKHILVGKALRKYYMEK